MSINIGEAYDEMARIVASEMSIEEGVVALIDGCAARCPDNIWESLRTFDFAADIAALHAWVAQTVSYEPPAKEINAFWFGLFNPILEDGADSCCLYISGSTRYSPTDVDSFVWKDDSYLPTAKYADSKVLKDIYRSTQDPSKGECGILAEYMLCLGYSALVLHDFFRSADTKLTLGESVERIVVVGFDAGDYIELGKINHNGWDRNIQP